MSLSPEDDLSEQTCVTTPKIKLDDEFISCQQEKMNVYLRIRPLLPAEILQDNKMCICVEDSHIVRAVAPLESAKFKSSAHDNSGLKQVFRFTGTFGPEVDQVQFFEETMKTTLENFIRGQNELVFAYGSTGSGKTYTMQGGLTQPGVIPLTIHLLFCSIKEKQVMSPTFKPHKYSDVINLSKSERDVEETAREKLLLRLDSEGFDDSRSLSGKSSVSAIFSDDSLNASSQSGLTDKEISILESTMRMKSLAQESVNMQGEVLFSVWVSFVEIYNENIYDLLEPVTSNKRTRLSLKEDENRNIYVRGLKEIRVTSSEEALKLFTLGKRNLRIASTKLNYQSSRSHCIFSIKVIRVLGIDSPLSARVNRLSYCDLAGSERSAKTQNTGMRLKEAGNINTSLMVLGRCIEALRQQGPKDKKVVPYRDSKLTRLFSAYFTGKGKASMIINVSPASHIFDETLNVLKFSALAKQVVSNDLSLKPLSHWNKEISRLTEAWEKSSTRWSSFCKSSISQKESTDMIAETSMEDENDIEDSFEEINQRDQIIEELLAHIKTQSTELTKVLMEKENLETEIRAQVCREFAENFVRIDNCYREQLKDFEESGLGLSKEVCKKIDSSKDADEEDNAEDSDEDSNDEKGYTSAHEDTPPPVLSKAIEDSESEMLEDKSLEKGDQKSGRSNNNDGKAKSSLRKTKDRRQNNTLKDNEVKKYESMLVSKDAVIKELETRIEKQNVDMFSFEKKLQEYENTAKSKDADLAALRVKMEETELTFDKESVEYEKILSSKGEEVIRMKEKMKEQDATIALRENEMREFENVLAKRDQEISRLRKKFESEVATKDKELNECLKSLNSRAQEVTELKGRIEEMMKVIVSNEKRIEDCVSVMNLKDVEISLLTGTDVAPKANGIKQYETALRSKDDEISELKKKIDTEHFDLMEKEKELEGYKNSMNLKDNELAVFKRKLEENGIVVPKEDELNECEIKAAEICELKKALEKLQEDLASKDKEIEDFKSIVSLKNTEVYLLKEKIEESEVIIAKPKDWSESEALVKSKDQSIARLKKEIEDSRKTMFFKDKDLEECRNKLNSKEKELSSLREKIEEHEVIIPKCNDIKEYKKSLNSKEAEVMRLHKKIDELQVSVTSKDGLIQELESTIQKGGDILITKDSEINELQNQISDLKNKNKRSKDNKTKDDNNIIKTQELEIASLSGKIDKLNKTVTTKDSKIKEKNNIIKFQETEMLNLKAKIEKLDKTVLSKNDLIKELKKKIKETEEILSSKDAENHKLHRRVSEFESNKSQDGRIKEVHEKESRKTEMLCPDDKEIIELQQKIAEVGSKALESKAPEWQNVQYLTELVQESSKTFASQHAKIAEMKQKYNDLVEKVEEGKKLIQQEFSKKFEEQEESLSKKNAEIKELECKLAEEKLIQQEFCKKFEEQEGSVSKKSAEIKELECKLSEEKLIQQEFSKNIEEQEASVSKKISEIKELECKLAEEVTRSKEKRTLNENQTKILGELIMVLQQVELQAYSRISDLEKKLLNFKDELNKKNAEVQELITKAKEDEEKARQKAEEEKERWKEKEEKEKLKAQEEKERQKAEHEKERQKAEEEKERWKAEERERYKAQEIERLRAEEEKKVEREMQTESSETKKDEKEVQTENARREKIVEGRINSADDMNKTGLSEGWDWEIFEDGVWPKEQKDLRVQGKFHNVGGNKNTDFQKKMGTSEFLKEEDPAVMFEDDVQSYKESVDPFTKLKRQISFAGCLANLLQRIENLATETIVRLNTENRNYCKKFLVLSQELDVMKVKLAVAEQEIKEKEIVHKKLVAEQDSGFESRKVSMGSSLESTHLIDTMQKIEYLSSLNINRLSSDNLRILRENNVLLDQVQASRVELDLATQEIERKDQEYCRIQGFLRKKDARILCLEYELSDAHKKINSLEAKSKMQLLEERTQHGIEVEQVMALKRQAETDYRSLERKLKITTGTAEVPLQRKEQTGSTEETKQRKKQTRPPRYKGRKRTSADEDKDFEPTQKKRMIKSQSYFVDEDRTCSASLGAGKVHSIDTPSSLQRLQEFVAEKSPVIKAAAHRVATFLSPKSGGRENSNTTIISKKKKKLFSNSRVPIYDGSPIAEVTKVISPKKIVSKKFRDKNISK